MLQSFARWNRWYDDLDRTNPFLRFLIFIIPWAAIITIMDTALRQGQKGLFLSLLLCIFVILMIRVSWLNGWLKLKSK